MKFTFDEPRTDDSIQYVVICLEDDGWEHDIPIGEILASTPDDTWTFSGVVAGVLNSQEFETLQDAKDWLSGREHLFIEDAIEALKIEGYAV